MRSRLDDVDPEIVRRYALDRVPFDRPSVATADLISLSGRRAIVTGGGGEGLGNATGQRLAEQGADVAVLDISAAAADVAATAIAERWGVRTLGLAADVASPDGIDGAVQQVLGEWGGVDILVNNAGGSGSVGASGQRVSQHGTFLDMGLEDLVDVVNVNLVGVMLVTRAVLPTMIEQGQGRIINVASEGGKISVDGLTVYNSCKSAVIGFTRNIAREVGRFGVSVTCVCPGIMVSERTVRTMSTAGAVGLASLDSTFPRVTIGRCSVPDEVASVISFLASDAGGYVHGTSVSVGGGMAD